MNSMASFILLGTVYHENLQLPHVSIKSCLEHSTLTFNARNDIGVFSTVKFSLDFNCEMMYLL